MRLAAVSVKALSVVVGINPGEEQELKRILLEIGAHPDTNPYIRLNESPSTHLANWVIVNDPDNGYRLFFASNHDGDLRSYVQELLNAGPGIDDIFKHCKGYAGKGQFLPFVEKNSYPSQTFFVGFQNETVQSVRAKIAIREQIETFLDLPDVARFLNEGGIQRFLSLLQQVSRPERGGGIGRLLASVHKTLHTWFFAVVTAFAKWYGALRVDKHCISVASNLDQPKIPASLSDADHMTNMIDVRPGFRLILRFSLGVMQFLAKFAYPPGELAGVTTIHFARWLFVDGGRRLLFQSRFDGTWENYMGDFVDKLAWGLDAIWSNTADYPPAGMNDLDAFKRFIRDRQFEHLAVYEAYPLETVLNQMRDREISAMLGNGLDRDAVRSWLNLL
jgi:hypothetical protein